MANEVETEPRCAAADFLQDRSDSGRPHDACTVLHLIIRDEVEHLVRTVLDPVEEPPYPRRPTRYPTGRPAGACRTHLSIAPRVFQNLGGVTGEELLRDLLALLL